MNYSDLHTHTVFSDGQNTIEEMVRAAIRRNMVSIGISDHSYTACDESYCMRKDDLPLYIAEIRHIAEKYKEQISVFAGLELDYYSDLDAMCEDLDIDKMQLLEKLAGINYQYDADKNQFV